ncbi:DEAD/DEAH box helicase family protein (plasmid) [Mammaliicoccus sciuri]|nr:DEAD/DEAH box helicase family protein [Mammaliicoccus sciuri]
MSFWMATGSGKSLVLIKLITILNTLIENNEIPNRDILILVPRDDLMEQLILLIDEYNKTIDNSFIELHSLKDLDEVKYSNSFNLDTIQVFYYRSDNISDVEKEKQINFKNYDNNGEWYILLDEAHKGGKEGSKRQAYFTSLARNGFLFNFSATFTDELDKATTIYNFNLEKFIMYGYGKNIYLSNSEYTSFIKSKKEVDFTNFEKEKIVAKSLIMLTATKLSRESIRDLNLDMFHSPLLLTLVDSVNKNDSDLLLFFKEIEKFANNTIEINVIRDAKKELIHELKNKNKFLFGEKSIDLNVDIIESITNESILKKVFNVNTPGAIEVMQSPDNKELAFRIKSSDISSPFALIKIGDVTPWIKTKLVDYDFIETFSNKNYFKTLDSNENINILMGSRSFYEGWDSSRPNIINFINIGKSTDSKKFLLQSIGRG